MKSARGLSCHVLSCTGTLNIERNNLASKRVHHLDLKTVELSQKRERNIMADIMHPSGMEPVSFSLKKQKKYHGTFAAAESAKSSNDESGSRSSSSDSSSSDDDSYTGQSCGGVFDGDGVNDYMSITKQYDETKCPKEEAELPFTTRAGIPTCSRFQIDLADILGRHRTDLTLYDELIDLIKSYSSDREMKFSSINLKKRRGFIKSLEETFKSQKMKPEDVTVKLSHGKQTTVSVFDIEAMIVSLLTDETLMKEENLAEGYDLHSGRSTVECTHYGEIHTGDAWEPARKHYCGDYPQNMPIALVIFGDKSHFDLHGALATTPIIFTLSCFNEKARNHPDFWRPLAYIPNLSYGKVAKEESVDNLQDEHSCIRTALGKLREIHRRGGIALTVKGKPVIGKVWIHYIIGDCSGNNRWAGHYNNSGELKRPYRDCHCCYQNMNNANPFCRYITLEEYAKYYERMENADSKTAKTAVCKSISQHHINNAFLDEDVPLSDLVHGIFRMLPPELLHTTSEGITEYMIASLTTILKNADRQGSQDPREVLDSIHQTLHNARNRNSERDFPRSASRTAFTKNTLVNATERRGNLFLLLCICHTDGVQNHLFYYLKQEGIDPNQFLECIKMYLAMEEWFHETNEKQKVRKARTLIGRVISNVQEVFPRDKGQGWHLQKTHGLTKMQYYMCLFGSGINFYGGPGECNHKKFVKDTGNNTQCRIDSFTSQVAQRLYETMLFEIAKDTLDKKIEKKYQLVESTTEETDYTVRGQYELTITGITDEGIHEGYTVKWTNKNKSRNACDVPYAMLTTLAQCMHKNGCPGPMNVRGYTECQMKLKGRVETFRATNVFGGKESWYDWALIKYGNQTYYPAKILGFFKYNSNSAIGRINDNLDELFAVIQSATEPMSMEKLGEEFISQVQLGTDHEKDYCIVPAVSISDPLFIYANYGGSAMEHFCALPKRKWGQYFDSKIDKI